MPQWRAPSLPRNKDEDGLPQHARRSLRAFPRRVSSFEPFGPLASIDSTGAPPGEFRRLLLQSMCFDCE